VEVRLEQTPGAYAAIVVFTIIAVAFNFLGFTR